MIFFTKNPNLKGRGRGWGARENEFFTKNPNLKIKKKLLFYFYCGAGGIGWREIE